MQKQTSDGALIYINILPSMPASDNRKILISVASEKLEITILVVYGSMLLEIFKDNEVMRDHFWYPYLH